VRKEKNILRLVFIGLCLLILPSITASETIEYRDYTVEKGDTLWDISGKELQDPFLWPKVWKENPEIRNPDLIFPRQKIKIPLHLLQKQIKPEPRPEAKPEFKTEIKPEPAPEKIIRKPLKPVEPVAREYLVDKNLLTASGYIAESVHSLGSIVETPTGRTSLGKGDYAYIKTDVPVSQGEKFFIIEPVTKVKHPKTGRFLGYLIDVLAIAEVVEQEPDDNPKILITNNYREVSPGNLLDTFSEIDPPFAPEAPRKPDINGYIVAAKELHDINGTWDIVYIDKGRNDGMEVGDLLATTLQSPHKIYNGLIQIISVKKSTSTAIVRKSNIEISVGDGITGVRQD
jgi:hypothetical protein